VRRRLLSALLSGLVACFCVTAVERVASAGSGGPGTADGAEHPTLVQAARPETRVGRPSRARAVDGVAGGALLGVLIDPPALAPPPALLGERSDPRAAVAGRSAFTPRSSRGPPAARC
jgi:hypothetical protein